VMIVVTAAGAEEATEQDVRAAVEAVIAERGGAS
jgi:hypothetical protein